MLKFAQSLFRILHTKIIVRTICLSPSSQEKKPWLLAVLKGDPDNLEGLHKIQDREKCSFTNSLERRSAAYFFKEF
jgi:hypothetical protein